jgi:CheY-like chemotaxis protein
MERTADRKPVVLVVEDEQSIEMVEDEQLVRMPAIEMVEEAGFEAIEAIDANEAIRILESRSDIRAVFTDIQMPGSMDGLKLARALRDRWPPGSSDCNLWSNRHLGESFAKRGGEISCKTV